MLRKGLTLTFEDRARRFAKAAHGLRDQRRRYTGEPYIVHPAAVVKIVRTVPHTREMLAAAWLHDVVEDTAVSIELVRDVFGDVVGDLVDDLTDPSKPEDGNRAARRAIDRAHSAAARPQAKTIKLADIIDNTKCIATHDHHFARVYLPEIELLLDVLKEGDPTLYARAVQSVSEAKRSLT